MRVKFWVTREGMLLARKEDYQTVFGTEAGRRVLADLYNFAGMGRDEMPPGAEVSGLHLANYAGKRRMVLRIASILNQEVDEILRLATTVKPYEVEGGETHDD
jgi:hypothetical protein